MFLFKHKMEQVKQYYVLILFWLYPVQNSPGDLYRDIISYFSSFSPDEHQNRVLKWGTTSSFQFTPHNNTSHPK